MRPTRIICGPYTLPIVWSRPEMDRERAERRAGLALYASTDFRRGVIYMDPDACLPEQQIGLWHEMTHVAVRVSGGWPAGEVTEEQIVGMTEAPMVDLIRQNPVAIAFIQQPHPITV